MSHKSKHLLMVYEAKVCQPEFIRDDGAAIDAYCRSRWTTMDDDQLRDKTEKIAKRDHFDKASQRDS
jgi:hypothetical protein